MPTGIVKPARSLTQRAPMAAESRDQRKSKSAKSFHAYVAVRVRPPEPAPKPRVGSPQSLIRFPGNASLAFNWQGMQRHFNFDVVFEEAASQTEVFDNCGVKDLIQMALEGYNCTCFAYGQTNSGKTYTMTGPPDETQQLGIAGLASQSRGLVPRSFAHILDLLRSRGTSGYKVYATYFEIYNEQITDLLNPRSIYPHTIRWSATSGFYVDNLFVIECETADDLMGVLAAGLANRRMDRGSQNDYSSRSHSLFSIMIDTQVSGEAGQGQAFVTRHGKLTFVDLAGSESTSSGAREPDQMLETSTINKSLLVLGNCISALSDPKKRAGHVPYRDSKLTKLLSDSLGGSGVSLMIACVNPSPEQGSETINTLRYASRAKRIEVCPEVNLDPQEKLLRTLKQEVASLRQENSSLREQLRASAAQSEAGGGDRGSGRRIVKSREASPGSSEDRPNGAAAGGAANGRPVSKGSYQSLYEMLQEYMQENETLRSENLDLAKHQSDYRREQNQLSEENRRLANQLSRMRQQFDKQQQQQQHQQQQLPTSTQQRRTPLYVVSNPETPALPPIEVRLQATEARGSARLPPRSPQWSLPPADSLTTAAQPLRRHQLPFEFAPTPPPPLLPLPLSHHLESDRQPQPIAMPPPPPPPLLQLAPHYQPAPHPPPQPRHQSPRLLYPEAPVYVPQPGERTYRDRFEAAAGRDRQRGQAEAATSRTVQELARLNASLRGELRQLDGAIQQHQRVNALQSDIRRNEGRKVLSF